MDILHILHRLSDITLGAGLVLFSLYRKKMTMGSSKEKTLLWLGVACILLWVIGSIPDLLQGLKDGVAGQPMR